MKIKIHADKVIFDGIEICGHIDQEQSCSTCKNNLIYYDDFDAFFCAACNCWSESTCSEPSCRYCPNRPETPLPNQS